MGTNYYHETDVCPHCGRSDTLHIGKNSSGWRFVFRSHLSPPLTTNREWVERLTTTPGRITDEYGDEVTLEQFVALLAPKVGQLVSSESGVYLDKDGYPFCRGEFS